jgi:hypothetical protein
MPFQKGGRIIFSRDMLGARGPFERLRLKMGWGRFFVRSPARSMIAVAGPIDRGIELSYHATQIARLMEPRVDDFITECLDEKSGLSALLKMVAD